MAGLRGLIVGLCVVVGSISFCRAEDRKAEAEAGSWIVLQQGLDKDAARYEISLSMSDTRSGQPGNQQIEKAFRRLDGAGTVLHVEPDAQDKLERVLTGINEMIRSLSLTSDPNLPAGPAPSAAPVPSRRLR